MKSTLSMPFSQLRTEKLSITTPYYSGHPTYPLDKISAAIMLVLASSVWTGSIASAQSNYTTPYTFTTLAGRAPGSTDGTGSAARFNAPSGVALDSLGNTYIADANNHLIRKMTPTGVVTTLAGGAGVAGDTDGVGVKARFNKPVALVLDSNDNIYVADSGNHAIRKITPIGLVTTYANGANGFFESLNGIAIDHSGNLYISDGDYPDILKVTPNGAISPINLTFSGPAIFNPSWVGVAVDSLGNIYASNSYDQTLYKITPSGLTSEVVPFPGKPYNILNSLAVDAENNIYGSATADNAIVKLTPRGTVTVVASSTLNPGSSDGPIATAQLLSPVGLAVDSSGNVIFADGNNTIRRVSHTGQVKTLAGWPSGGGSSDGTGSNAQFANPFALALDSHNYLYVADQGAETIRVVSPSGQVTTLAKLDQLALPTGITVDSAGNVYTANYNSGSVSKIDPTGTIITFSAQGQLFQPFGITVDAIGNLYLTDSGNYTIDKISPAGNVTIVAGVAGVSGSNDGSASSAHFGVFSGGPEGPEGIAIDHLGNIFVADTGNSTIREISSLGVVSTIAGKAGVPGSTDGLGTAARFNEPVGLSLDASGNLFVADAGNSVVRKITPAGLVSTVGGLVNVTGSTDGAGQNARFGPRNRGVAVAPNGLLYVADSENHTIRMGMAIPTASNASVAGIINQPLSFQVSSVGYGVTYTLRGELPTGLSFTKTGLLSGTPALAGTRTLTLSATNAAGTGTAQLTLTIRKLDQTITFSTLGKQSAAVPFAPGATASSGLPITYSVVSGPATVVGNKVNFTGAGRVLIEGTQPGNRDFAPATAQANVIAVQAP